MGILREAPQAYYNNTSPDFGNYRQIPLQEIIDSFNAA